MQRWLEVARGTGDARQASYALVQQSCVTDDLLARWLQRLAGRQVVLLMDTCHSAGYADRESSADGTRAFKPIMAGDLDLVRFATWARKIRCCWPHAWLPNRPLSSSTRASAS